MDLKKLFKKLGFSENFFYSARKVFSGFSLGVGASLLLTVLFLNNPFKASTFHPVSQSSLGPWPFSFSSTGEQSVQERTHQGSVSERSGNFSLDEKTHSGNFSDKGNNTSFWDSSGGEGVIDRTHGGNFSENVKNGSFFGLQGRVGDGNSKNDTSIGGADGLLLNTQKNGSLVGKSGEFTDKVPEGNNMANVSSNGESVRSIVGEESVAGGTKEVKPVQGHSNGTLIGTSNGFADMGIENNNTHNVLGNEKSGEPVGRGGNITGSTEEAKPVESDKNETFTGKTGGFAGMGTERNNTGSVSSKGEIVKSTSVPEKIHEGNSSRVNKFGNSSNESQVGDYNLDKCDIFDGRWVRDEGKPYYPAGSCPHIDRDFDCHLNGRPDNDFLKWRWQPNHCDIPSLNATDFLERLRGKKLIFVGDSLNRNMWESLVCILRHSVADKKKVYEISGRKEFKKKGFYAFRYEEYNCSVDFVSAPFLVRESSVKTRNGSLETLRLDLMDRTTSTYHDADVIVFNTGHWWTHEKTSKGENYYQEGNHVYPTLKVLEAYMKALTTWARWIDKNIDAKRTHVIFRGYSETHFSGGQWNSGGQCHKEIEPIFNDTYLAKYPSKMKVLEHVLEGMSTPVVYMNISRLTDYRKDAHPSIYRKEYKTVEEKIAAERSQDCSHWCLPGVPDTWNELLYASLLRLGIGS